MEGVASEEESSSDDDYQWRQEYKKQQKDKITSNKQPRFYELKSGEEFTSMKQKGDEKRKKTWVDYLVIAYRRANRTSKVNIFL